ncbi:hypothetical protein NPIL_564131 [Nephila pilipes]|uniref:Uncharacterized protein n=1 Tax=Nephila pilipes TaxID=299642 RepID=A0A8X6PMB9_NEPPI|nr:hypothetical protein NPIL_564131 [Nephila pilipes]
MTFVLRLRNRYGFISQSAHFSESFRAFEVTLRAIPIVEMSISIFYYYCTPSSKLLQGTFGNSEREHWKLRATTQYALLQCGVDIKTVRKSSSLSDPGTKEEKCGQSFCGTHPLSPPEEKTQKRSSFALARGSSGVLFLVSGQGRDPHRVTGGDLLRRMTRFWVRRSQLLDAPRWPEMMRLFVSTHLLNPLLVTSFKNGFVTQSDFKINLISIN